MGQVWAKILEFQGNTHHAQKDTKPAIQLSPCQSQCLRIFVCTVCQECARIKEGSESSCHSGRPMCLGRNATCFSPNDQMDWFSHNMDSNSFLQNGLNWECWIPCVKQKTWTGRCMRRSAHVFSVEGRWSPGQRRSGELRRVITSRLDVC